MNAGKLAGRVIARSGEYLQQLKAFKTVGNK